MPNHLTKKFTRDSLKRATHAKNNDDASKQQVIQTEMARARAKSLQSRNALARTSNRVNNFQANSQYRSLLADDTAHVNAASTTNHYNAEILNTMSSLTEPTWAPSMSMQSGLGSMADHTAPRYEQRHETLHEEEDPVMLNATKNMPVHTGYPHLHPQQPVSPRSTKTTKTAAEERDPPPPEEQKTTRHRKKERDGKKSRSRKDRSSSVSSRRSTYSVPVDPRQFTESKKERKSRRRSKSDAKSTSSKRSSSVPPARHEMSTPTKERKTPSRSTSMNQHHEPSRSRSMSVTNQSETAVRPFGQPPKLLDHDQVTTTPSHDDEVAAAMAKFRMYEESKKLGNDAVVTAMSEDKSRSKSILESTEHHWHAILAIDDNTSVAGSVAASTASKPRNAVEAARMSLRPTIRRTNSNRSMSSMNSESFSLASSARMTSSKSDGTPKQIEANRQTNAIESPKQRSPSVSRIQKLKQDSRTRAIHQSKTKFHQSLKPKKEEGHPEDEPGEILPKNSMTVQTVTSFERNAAQEPFDEQLDHQIQHAPNSISLVKTLFVIVKYILWHLPQDIAGILYSIFGFFTGRGQWTARNKTVLVTGASTSMGAETARQLAMEGAQLALVAPTSLEDLEQLAQECGELGASKIHVYSADLSYATGAQMTIQQAAKDFGGHFDVAMVHGQSLGQGCYFEEIQDASEMEHMMKENALSCMLTLHHALPHIPKTSDSRIVVVSSTSGMIASPYQSVYAASQHALTGFCNSLRMELNKSYSRKAPKVCLVSLPDVACKTETLKMGAALPPQKAKLGLSLQHAVHDVLEAVGQGQREFGTPSYMKRWQCMSVVAPRLTEWSINRHIAATQYRPSEENMSAGVVPNMKFKQQRTSSSVLRQRHHAGGQPVSTKTWS